MPVSCIYLYLNCQYTVYEVPIIETVLCVHWALYLHKKKFRVFQQFILCSSFTLNKSIFFLIKHAFFFKNISKPTLFTSMFTLVSSLHFCLLLIWIQMYTIIHFLPTQQIIFFQFTDPHPPIPGGYTALWISFLDIADGAQDLAEGCWMFYSRNWTVCVCTYGYVQH